MVYLYPFRDHNMCQIYAVTYYMLSNPSLAKGIFTKNCFKDLTNGFMVPGELTEL